MDYVGGKEKCGVLKRQTGKGEMLSLELKEQKQKQTRKGRQCPSRASAWGRRALLAQCLLRDLSAAPHGVSPDSA